jgi:hypothetical protein
MQPRQLKRLIQEGHYRPEPNLVAEAMLQHRGVRDLLTNELSSSFNPTGRTPSPSAVPRRAA